MLKPDFTTVRRLADVSEAFRRQGFRGVYSLVREALGEPGRLPGRIVRALWVGGIVLFPKLAAWLYGLLHIQARRVVLFYDLAVSPITFDICWALAAAERLRKEKGLEHVQLVLVPGFHEGLRVEDADYEAVINPANRRWRLDNIILPVARLLPSLDGVTICSSRSEALIKRIAAGPFVYPLSYWPSFPAPHHPRDLIDAARDGQAIPLPLQAPPHALHVIDAKLNNLAKGRRVVSITLRNYGYAPERNSNLEAWSRFAASLDPRIWCLVVVPDADNLSPSLPPELAALPLFPEAAANVFLRMALYERAWLNMMVNNGPHGLCMFNENCRYLMFKIITPGIRQTSPEYMLELGFELLKDPPFARPWQRWVWADDDPKALEAHFQAFCRDFGDSPRNPLLEEPMD